jgi:regulator of replication initiation timing
MESEQALTLENDQIEQQVAQTGDPAPESPPEEHDVEDIARARGWKPQQEYRGQQPWVDAKTFNERYDNVMPFVRSENRTLRGQNAQLAQDIQSLRNEIDELRRHNQSQQEQRQVLQIQTLEAEHERAMSEGDWPRAAQLGAQLLDMKVDAKVGATTRAAQQQTQPQIDPAAAAAIQDFQSRYPIFMRDNRLGRALGIQVKQIQEVARMSGQTNLDPAEVLEEAADNVRRMFPERFHPNGRPAMAETRGAPARSSRGPRTWDDLKPEVKTTLEEFIVRNPKVTREAILKSVSADDFAR